MAGASIAAVVAAGTAINKAVELTKTVLDLSKKAANLELQERVADLRAAVLDAKDEVLALREANQTLQERVAHEDQWNRRAAEYTLVRTNGGAIVWHSAGPPEHFACPACFEAKKVHILQDPNNYAGTFHCSGPGCNKAYPVRPSHSMAGEPQRVRVERL